jgi:BirA family biotin operon repressor/biotin-[acetyl-CoA-carboxylase] ligase
MTATLPGGFGLLRLGTVTSTNDVARELAEGGREGDLFVVADRQTAGRGRLGRSWQSPPGNLHASLLLRPDRPLAGAASLSLVLALVLAETLEALSAGRLAPTVKWPNDVLANGAKLAGILLEGAADARGRCQWLIAGIGVNVAWSPGPEVVGYPTTDLRHEGLGAIGPEELLEALAAPLRAALEVWAAQGFAPFRERWSARTTRRGEPIELRLGSRVVDGTFAGIDPDGAILLARASGEVERFTAGELTP